MLGPLLFLIYVNDVADLFTDGPCVKMYADDVKLYLEIETYDIFDIFENVMMFSNRG